MEFQTKRMEYEKQKLRLSECLTHQVMTFWALSA